MIEKDIKKILDCGLTLTETYPYLAWLAEPLAEKCPHWLQEFQKTDGAKIELDQARNFAFLAFAEARWPEELYRLVAQVIEEGPDYLSHELANTADWYGSVEPD